MTADRKDFLIGQPVLDQPKDDFVPKIVEFEAFDVCSLSAMAQTLWIS